MSRGKFGEAEQLYREILAKCLPKLGETHIDTIRVKVNLGTVSKQRGDLKEAMRLFREALPVFKEKLGEDSGDTLTLMNNLAEVHKAMKVRDGGHARWGRGRGRGRGQHCYCCLIFAEVRLARGLEKRMT